MKNIRWGRLVVLLSFRASVLFALLTSPLGSSDAKLAIEAIAKMGDD